MNDLLQLPSIVWCILTFFVSFFGTRKVIKNFVNGMIIHTRQQYRFYWESPDFWLAKPRKISRISSGKYSAFKNNNQYFSRSFFYKLRRKVLSICRLQCTIDLLRWSSSAGFQSPMSPQGLMGSLGQRRGCEGDQSIDESVLISDFQMLAGMDHIELII